VGLDAASPSYVPGPIPAGTWEVVVGKAKIVETPAEYDVCIILRTEPTEPPQPREPYADPGVLDDEARWYAGDFHVQGGIWDAIDFWEQMCAEGSHATALDRQLRVASSGGGA